MSEQYVRVPRELLERVSNIYVGGKHRAGVEALGELRGLLAAPAEDVRAVGEETLFQRGWRLAKEGHGISNLWGNCSKDSEMDEVLRGMEACRQSLRPVVLPECPLGYGHAGRWCGPEYNCWLDSRPKGDE